MECQLPPIPGLSPPHVRAVRPTSPWRTEDTGPGPTGHSPAAPWATTSAFPAGTGRWDWCQQRLCGTAPRCLRKGCTAVPRLSDRHRVCLGAASPVLQHTGRTLPECWGRERTAMCHGLVTALSRRPDLRREEKPQRRSSHPLLSWAAPAHPSLPSLSHVSCDIAMTPTGLLLGAGGHQLWRSHDITKDASRIRCLSVLT